MEAMWARPDTLTEAVIRAYLAAQGRGMSISQLAANQSISSEQQFVDAASALAEGLYQFGVVIGECCSPRAPVHFYVSSPVSALLYSCHCIQEIEHQPANVFRNILWILAVTVDGACFCGGSARCRHSPEPHPTLHHSPQLQCAQRLRSRHVAPNRGHHHEHDWIPRCMCQPTRNAVSATISALYLFHGMRLVCADMEHMLVQAG
jgi:hypothetical protein